MSALLRSTMSDVGGELERLDLSLLSEDASEAPVQTRKRATTDVSSSSRRSASGMF